MKKLFFFILLISVSSCYDLDTQPFDKVSAGTFWKTEEHAVQGLMGVYADLNDHNTFGLYNMFDNASDIALGYDGQGLGDIIMGTFTDRSATVVNRWRRGYDGVQRANTVIRNVTAMDIPEDRKQVFVAEAKFLRALYYFYLKNLFGGLPLYDESVDLNREFNDLKLPRNTEVEVQAFILADLTAAIAGLPVSHPPAQLGRATKGAAYALRGKVYLYDKKWAEAIVDFEEIVQNKNNSYGYTLFPNYAGLFNMEGDNSSEMIFAIQNKGGVGFDYGMPFAHYLGTRSTFGSCWNNGLPSTKLADMYEYRDGTAFDWDKEIAGYNASKAVKRQAMVATLNSGKLTAVPDTAKLGSIYRNRDPRMVQTLVVPYSWQLGWNANAPRPMQLVLATGVNENFGQIRNNRGWMTYVWRKFVPEGNLNGELTNRAHTPFNFPLIRLADVYLMLAEAYNESGQIDKAVVELNKVRTRSSMPGLNSGIPALAVGTQAEMTQRIIKERAVELAGEGHRYFDLKRWGLLQAYTAGVSEKSIVDDVLLTRNFQGRHVIWPIPAQEIEVNPALTQNPEW